MDKVLPLFKSHFSIGKSILVFDNNDDPADGGPSSIFDIAKKNGLSEVYLVEDNISGLPLALKASKKAGIPIRYGQTFMVTNKPLGEESKEDNLSKVVLFASNDDGIREMSNIHSLIMSERDGNMRFEDLLLIKEKYKNIFITFPFYKSFLHKNHFSFSSFVFNCSAIDPVFFIEHHGLPEDDLLSNIVTDYCKQNGFKTIRTHTVLYEMDSDFDAYQTYRIACNREGSNGKKILFSSPNDPNRIGSDEFSFESFLRISNAKI